MPTVKRSALSVAPDALPGPYSSGATSPETFGSSIGDAIGRTGVKMYEEEVHRQDQVAFLEADRKLSSWENDNLYDPAKGALNKKGKDAFGLPEVVGKAYGDYVQQVRDGLTNDRQRVAFEKAATTRGADIQKTLSKHVFTEARKFEDVETENYIATAKQSAVLNHTDPERVSLETQRAQAAVMDYARRNGLGAEYIKQKNAQIASDITGGVIDRFLANGQDQSAKSYYDTNKSLIAGDDVTKIEQKLKIATTIGEGQRGAVAVWDKLGPKSDLAPINLDKMVDDARAQFADKPEVLKAVTEGLKEKANIFNAAQRERREANSDAVWRQIDAKVPIAKVAMMPEFLSLPGQEQTRIREHVTDRNRAEQEREGDDALYYARVTEASTPALRDQFLQRNLLDDRTKLSKAQFNHLIGVQSAIRTSDDKTAEKLLASDRQQSRMVDEALISLKLDPTPNEKTGKGDIEKIVGFRRAVRDAVRSQEVRSGKNATDAEVQSIVDGLMIEGVTKQRSLWFNETKRVYQLQPGESIAVKVTDVPRGERDKIESALRANNRPVNDQSIVELYQAKLLRMRGTNVPNQNDPARRVPQ